jgi:RHS repeat-associated protein
LSQFTGKERDAETGLDYFLARYYSGAQGRFLSPDEWKGGIVDPTTGQDIETNTALPYADITDPQTLNKYAYVRNNPLKYIDPDGHAFALDDALEGGALLYLGGAAILAGTIAVINNPEGQRSAGAFFSAASESFCSNINALKNKISNIFSKSDSKPTSVSNGNEQPQTATPPPPPLGGDNDRHGGGKTGQKYNVDRRASAEQKLESVKKELGDIRKIANKTKELAAKVRELEKQVKHLQRKVAEKSEIHVRTEQH